MATRMRARAEDRAIRGPRDPEPVTVEPFAATTVDPAGVRVQVTVDVLPELLAPSLDDLAPESASDRRTRYSRRVLRAVNDATRRAHQDALAAYDQRTNR